MGEPPLVTAPVHKCICWALRCAFDDVATCRRVRPSQKQPAFSSHNLQVVEWVLLYSTLLRVVADLIACGDLWASAKLTVCDHFKWPSVVRNCLVCAGQDFSCHGFDISARRRRWGD